MWFDYTNIIEEAKRDPVIKITPSGGLINISQGREEKLTPLQRIIKNKS